MQSSHLTLKNNTAFIFPGQGSQALGMLADFADTAIVRDTFEQASDLLGYDLWKVSQLGPENKLNQTNITQPVLLASSVALWRVWQQQRAMPLIVAGHSLGEYSALVCAGIVNFDEGVRLVEQRGLFMRQSVPDGVGKMAAIIGLADEKVQQACDISAQNEIVSPVNFNSPGQIVIAGNVDAVERAMQACKESGAKRALPLSVSVPSHCLLMKPAAQKLAQVLNSVTFSYSEIKVVNNVDVAVESSPERIKDALIRQLYCPVRWTETVSYLASQGIEHFVECGPGKVLSGLNRRIDKSLSSYQINNLNVLNQTVEVLS